MRPNGVVEEFLAAGLFREELSVALAISAVHESVEEVKNAWYDPPYGLQSSVA